MDQSSTDNQCPSSSGRGHRLSRILYCVPCFEVFGYNPIGSDRSDSSVKSDSLDNSGVSDFSLSSIHVRFVVNGRLLFETPVWLVVENGRSER